MGLGGFPSAHPLCLGMLGMHGTYAANMAVAECDRMIAATQANNVRLGIAYYRHFYPVVDRVKAVIESGEIGMTVSFTGRR